MNRPSIGLLVVGAASRDIDAADPRGWRLGGTVTYASLAAARLGVPVRALMGADEPAAGAHELELLRAAGVEVEIVPLARGPVFDNQQTAAGRVQIAHQQSDDISIAALPPGWLDTPTVFLGPVAAELGPEWAAALPATTFVALAWQGLLRGLTSGQPVRRLPLSRTPLVARANALFVSDEDARGDSTPISSLISSGQLLLTTHGHLGALALTTNDQCTRGRTIPPLPPRAPIDTTGTGDVFAASWLAARMLLGHAALREPWRVDLVAAAVASVSVLRRGLADVPGRADLCAELLTLRGGVPPR